MICYVMIRYVTRYRTVVVSSSLSLPLNVVVFRLVHTIWFIYVKNKMKNKLKIVKIERKSSRRERANFCGFFPPSVSIARSSIWRFGLFLFFDRYLDFLISLSLSIFLDLNLNKIKLARNSIFNENIRRFFISFRNFIQYSIV